MSLGLHDRRVRSRRRLLWSLLKIIGIAGILAALATYAYLGGQRAVEATVANLADERDDLARSLAASREQVAALEAKLRASENRIAELDARYTRDIPQGPAKRIFDLGLEKVRQGLPLDRLAFLIETASVERSCDPSTVTVRTRVDFEGLDTDVRPVSFVGNKVQVAVTGAPYVDEQGISQPWFNPAEPVTVDISTLSGDSFTETGVLPVRRSIVQDGSEFRFLIDREVQGYVSISMERCDYP